MTKQVKLKQIIIKDVFGEPMVMEGEIISERIDGFECDGSWSLYGHGKEGWHPCVKVRVRWKGKRKHSEIMKSRIISIERETKK